MKVEASPTIINMTMSAGNGEALLNTNCSVVARGHRRMKTLHNSALTTAATTINARRTPDGI